MSYDDFILHEHSVVCQSVLSRMAKQKGYGVDLALKVWKFFPGDKKAAAIYSCASDVSLDSCGSVVAANFCRDRWCPVCQWRKSRLLFAQNAQTFKYISDYYPGVRFVFLTLTIPNVSLFSLRSALADMSLSWHRMVMNQAFKRLGLLGYLRSTEITYNPVRDDFHPHFHCIFVVPEGVWLPDRNWWLDIWRTSCRDARITQVDIRSVKGGLAGLKEVSKYVVKASDLTPVFDFSKWFDLRSSVSGYRFVSFGGVWKDARAVLKLSDIESDPLTDNVDPKLSISDFKFDYSNGLYLPYGIDIYTD